MTGTDDAERSVAREATGIRFFNPCEISLSELLSVIDYSLIEKETHRVLYL